MAVMFVVYIPVEELDNDGNEDQLHRTMPEYLSDDKSSIKSFGLSTLNKPAKSYREESDTDSAKIPLLSSTLMSNSETANDKDVKLHFTENIKKGILSKTKDDVNGNDMNDVVSNEKNNKPPRKEEHVTILASNGKKFQDTESNVDEDCDLIELDHMGTEAVKLPEAGKPSKGQQALRLNIQEEAQLSVEYVSKEWALQTVLANHDIVTDAWVKTDDGHLLQVTFIVSTEYADTVLRALNNIGIGSENNTMISIYPANYFLAGYSTKAGEGDDGSAGKKTAQSLRSSDEKEQSEFMKSVKARLTVAQVVEVVKNNSRATFDFVLLIILAGIIASVGLAESSSVTLVASMLVSPLMGPIMGGTFGFVIQNKELTRLGVTSELLGLSMCLMIGFFMGLIMSGVNNDAARWGSSNEWPTIEMSTRGQTRSLWVGVLIALPSGAGVALSILGGNTGSMVGVAISASLLPPAVNAGLLWTQAIIWAAKPPPWESRPSVNDTITHGSGLNCGTLKDNAYEFTYSCTPAVEVAILGVVSFFLTILNIICIFIMGIIILKVKEVAPHTALSQYTEKFWKTDLKIARSTYKTMKTMNPESLDLAKMARELAQEAKLKGTKEEQIFEDTLEGLASDETFQSIRDHLPTKTSHLKKLQMEMKQERQQKEEEELRDKLSYNPYHTVVGPGTLQDRRLRFANSSMRCSTTDASKCNVRFQFDTPGKRHHAFKRRTLSTSNFGPASPLPSAIGSPILMVAGPMTQALQPTTSAAQKPRFQVQPVQTDNPPLPTVNEK